MLLNIESCQWDEDLLDLFEIPKSMLPEVLPSSHVYGESDVELLGGADQVGWRCGGSAVSSIRAKLH